MNDSLRMPGPRKDALLVAGIALAARVAVVVWAAARIPPAADGQFYHVIANRIAQGLGYTWLWPDGVVTYAAHYPVGYPAMLGGLYALFGAHPWVGMLANAVLGTGVAVLAHAIAREASSRRWALAVGILVALHPALVPYTAALMTEGLAMALCMGAVALAMWARRAEGRRRTAFVLGLGLVLGLGALVRPPTALLVLPLAWLATSSLESVRKRVAHVVLAVIVSLVVVSPWVVRNHVRMGEAGLSFNGGWNMLIGTNPSAKGTFAPLEVPEACREVFDEAKKDLCFGRAARERIAADPLGWVSLVPSKLGATFDYCGAAGWYLHEASAEAFPYRAKVVLGVIETVYSRVVWLAALAFVALLPGPRRRVRMVLAVGTGVFLFTHYGWVGVLGLLAALLLLGKALDRAPLAVSGTAAVLGATVLTHAAFFGGGRYGMVVLALVATLLGARSQERGSRFSRNI